MCWGHDLDRFLSISGGETFDRTGILSPKIPPKKKWQMFSCKGTIFKKENSFFKGEYLSTCCFLFVGPLVSSLFPGRWIASSQWSSTRNCTMLVKRLLCWRRGREVNLWGRRFLFFFFYYGTVSFRENQNDASLRKAMAIFWNWSYGLWPRLWWYTMVLGGNGGGPRVWHVNQDIE